MPQNSWVHPTKQLVDADVVRWQGAMPAPKAGHKEKIEAFRQSLDRLDGVCAVGAWLSGTGLVAVVKDTQSVIETYANELLTHH